MLWNVRDINLCGYRFGDIDTNFKFSYGNLYNAQEFSWLRFIKV